MGSGFFLYQVLFFIQIYLFLHVACLMLKKRSIVGDNLGLLDWAEIHF